MVDKKTGLNVELTTLSINVMESEYCKCEVELCGYKFPIYMKKDDYKNLAELNKKDLL